MVIDFRPSPPNECASGLASTSRAAARSRHPDARSRSLGADDQLRCVGESRITSHNIAVFRHLTDSMKDSKHGELKEEERRWVESQILPLENTAFVFKHILELVSCSTPGLDSNKAGSAILDDTGLIGPRSLG